MIRAEWTKFRTVRGWVAGTAVFVVVVVLLGVMFAMGSHSSCSQGAKEVPCPANPLGPGGEAVNDRFTFAHQPLSGDGSITVHLTSMTGIITYPPPNHDQIVSGLVPWAKAGVIIKQSTTQGAPYAAVALTGSHGVRMQHNFTEDIAGKPGPAPRWLRLTRAGDTITGYESADGSAWSEIGKARLAGLPETVQIGMFANSPGDLTVRQQSMGGSIVQMRFTQTSAVFDHVTLQGRTQGRTWLQQDVGVGDGRTDWEKYHRPNGLVQSGGTFTVTGTGDISPMGPEGGQSLERTLTGLLAGLIVMIVVAVLFITAEYRRGLIRTTLAAGPRRGRSLLAKALVIGAVSFAAGLVAAAVVVPVCSAILRGNQAPILPVPALTQVRLIVGTAALVAVVAVLALALGSLFRRSAAAVIVTIAVIVVPEILATASVLPMSAAQWLLRLTPAAGFAIQQTMPEYPQSTGYAAPSDGYYPLAPWAGFAVLCAYAALALGLAVHRLRRRDV
ncbi:ABC transporter permease subunit [Nonomuraea sp. NPDC050536]|uniref:ABC transporter permease subunit n=1 Tax=Nonomuraea sp. NPDC050536 TaxID=3364366 RepID=UPI0037C586E6